MGNYLIYGIFSKEGLLKYVGKSSSGVKRPKAHFFPSHYNKVQTYCARWIKKNIQQGDCPTWGILKYSTKDSLCEDEIKLIKEARLSGLKLLNLTDGGDGSAGFKHSESTKEKLRLINTGKDCSHRKKRDVSGSKNPRYGAILTEETKAKISEGNKGKAGQVWNENQILNLRAKKNSKVIRCVETGQIFNGGASEASKKLGQSKSNFRMAIKKGYRLHGHHWEYL
ncbi:MAG: NUMOD3 domain-containing DNA-binding protein [Pseudomonadota bacterium]|jgi:hypothetical protein